MPTLAAVFVLYTLALWATTIPSPRTYFTRVDRLPRAVRTAVLLLWAGWLLGAAIILLVIFLGISGGGPYGSGAIYGD